MCSKPVWITFFCETLKFKFLKNISAFFGSTVIGFIQRIKSVESIVLCVWQKESRTGLEQQEGEYKMTEFSFLGELSL